jgi:hypothetical protein
MDITWQMIFVQTKWLPVHYLVIFLSIGSWFAVAYLITNISVVDYEWYQVSEHFYLTFPVLKYTSPLQVWTQLLGRGNFWLGCLIIIFVIIGKDLYLCGLQRNFDPTSPQIIQEVKGAKGGRERRALFSIDINLSISRVCV